MTLFIGCHLELSFDYQWSIVTLFIGCHLKLFLTIIKQKWLLLSQVTHLLIFEVKYSTIQLYIQPSIVASFIEVFDQTFICEQYLVLNIIDNISRWQLVLTPIKNPTTSLNGGMLSSLGRGIPLKRIFPWMNLTHLIFLQFHQPHSGTQRRLEVTHPYSNLAIHNLTTQTKLIECYIQLKWQ